MRNHVRHPMSKLIRILMLVCSTMVVVILAAILIYILVLGFPQLKPSLFEWTYNSSNVSMMPAIINTVTITLISLLVAIPVSVGAAVFLAEYSKEGPFVKILRMAADTLSGIPSIVYGLFGFVFFSSFLHWGYSILSGSMTLFFMILPVMMRTAEEAIAAVPMGVRESSLALGATKVHTIMRVVIPASMQGIVAGVILGAGRVLGETAALMYSAGTASGIAKSLLKSGRTLSVHMYALMSEGLHMDEARAVAVVLLVFALGLNGLSKLISRKVGGEGNG